MKECPDGIAEIHELYLKLSPEKQKLARKLIRAVIDSLLSDQDEQEKN